MDRRAWLVTAVASAVLVACGGSDAPVVLAVNADGVSTVDSTALADSLAAYPLGVLSAAERDSLLYMREEEQLAHDVYAVSATIWPQPVFANIRDSEATHSAAIKALLDRYGLPDPLAGLPSGSFKSASVPDPVPDPGGAQPQQPCRGPESGRRDRGTGHPRHHGTEGRHRQRGHPAGL
jgi:hypothetical protein